MLDKPRTVGNKSNVGILRKDRRVQVGRVNGDNDIHQRSNQSVGNDICLYLSYINMKHACTVLHQHGQLAYSVHCIASRKYHISEPITINIRINNSI